MCHLNEGQSYGSLTNEKSVCIYVRYEHIELVLDE